MTILKAFIRRRSVLTYFVVAFAISWGGIVLVAGPGGIPVAAEQLELLGLAMLLGPSVAGILLTTIVSGKAGLRDLFSRLLKWRVSLRWYVIALLIAPLSKAAALFALSIRSSEFLPVIVTSTDKTSLLAMGIAAGLVVGLFEELGWTGFVVPRLRLRHGVVATGISVGLLWGAWHFLLFWESDSFSGALPMALLFGRLFAWLPAYRVLMVWIYDRTGSLLVTTLMHVSLVASTVIVEPPLTGERLLTFILLWAVLLWGLVAAVVAVSGGQISRMPRP